MFDPDENAGVDMSQRRRTEAKSPVPVGQTPDTPKRKANNLDSEEMMELHGRLLQIYRRELDRQFENRAEQSIDADFYDNIQWTAADLDVLEERGQKALTYNVVSTAINWVTGTEKRSRMDYKILPRRKEDSKPAERKTALLKYLSDVNRSPFNRSRAFEDAVKVGVGWLESGIEDAAGGDPLYDRYESWRNMLWDSAATEKDLDDARFVSRSKWVDIDILKSLFPKRAELIEESVDPSAIYASGIEIDGDEAMDSYEIAAAQDGLLRDASINGYLRNRSRVIEMWFRKPTMSFKMVGGHFSGDMFDWSDAHIREVKQGNAYVERKPVMRMYVGLFTAKGFLWFGESPYRHNRYPFTPIFANRRDRDGMPYGMIRGLRSIQEDINKRASKALHIMNTSKTIMDEGAVADLDEFAQEVARPDAIIVKKAGKQIELNADRGLEATHLEFMSRSINMIQQTSGITDELMGQKTNATSGIAIQRRQDQGSTTTTTLFDNLRFANQVHGEKQLSLIEQFYNEKKDFRITNMRGTPEYVTLNSGLPQDDITRSKADFIVSEQDFHATLRQAAAEQLLQAVQTLGPAAPQLVMGIIDLIVENMDLPNREEIVQRIRKVTGQADPDQEGPTPEQVQAAQKAQLMQQYEMQMGMAKLADLQAGAKKKMADALHSAAATDHTQAQTQLITAQIGKILADGRLGNVQAQADAIEAALALIANSGAAPVADTILREAGYGGNPEQAARGDAPQQPQRPTISPMPPGIGSVQPTGPRQPMPAQ